MEKNRTIIRWSLMLLLFYCFSIDLGAQVSHGGSPLPFSQLRSGTAFSFEEMPAFDLQEQLCLDSMEYDGLRASNRFAYKFMTDFTPDNSGEWFTLADGTRVWRLGIRSEGAVSLNLLFSEYELPEGAQLFLYNPSQSQVRGAFTHQNNSEKHLLPVSPIYGDEVIIECSPEVSVQDLCDIMSISPDWMPGILIRGDGYQCDFYRKDS